MQSVLEGVMAPNDALADLLRELLVVCRDGEEGYAHAACDVDDHVLREAFTRRSIERARFAVALVDAIQRLGADPGKKGSTLGALHRRWLDARAKWKHEGTRGILAECERGERVALEVYEDALAKELPNDVRDVIERQYVAIRDACADVWWRERA
jgi:uncharacterized protein (TIGR02284 family)